MSLALTGRPTGYSSGTTGLSKGVELTHFVSSSSCALAGARPAFPAYSQRCYQNLTSVLNESATAMPAVNSGRDSVLGFL